MATSNVAQHHLSIVGFVEETTPGVTPASPSMRQIPVISSSIKSSSDLVVPQALNSNRKKKQARKGNIGVGGDIETELAYGVFDPLFRSVMMSPGWVNQSGAERLQVGTSRNYLTFEDKVDGQDTPFYERFTGCMIGSMTISVANNDTVKVTFGVSGLNSSISDTPLDSTPGVGSPEVYVSDTFIFKEGSLSLEGVDLGYIGTFEITLNNNLETIRTAFSDVGYALQYGDAEVSGTLSGMIPNRDLLNYYRNETTGLELLLSFEDRAGNIFQVRCPSIMFNDYEKNVGGTGARMQNVPFTASDDGTADSPIAIIRIPG